MTIFKALGEYKDSKERIENCLIGKYGEELYYLFKAKIGDYCKFGSYEQNNNASDGKEKIEWIVLDKNGNSLLLCSKYALDYQQYNTTFSSVTWETCSLRKWLNETFVRGAFSSDEQNMILDSIVKADKNPAYNTAPGNNTTDKVFLLGITEVEKYFSSIEARRCVPTDYAIDQGVIPSDRYTVEGKATCWWWLRSPGPDSHSAAVVHNDGYIGDFGEGLRVPWGPVRPAMWISLEP